MFNGVAGSTPSGRRGAKPSENLKRTESEEVSGCKEGEEEEMAGQGEQEDAIEERSPFKGELCVGVNA